MEKTLPHGRAEIAPTDATRNEIVKSTASESTGIDNRLVWLMAMACGLLAANLIYAQPLLADMGHTFAVSVNRIGLTSTLGLLGYAIGLLLIIPLGEKYSQRLLIVVMLSATALSLAFMAVAPTASLLVIASGAVGVTSTVPELIIPFTASLASPNERGRVVGIILCGFLTGTPLASILSGFVGHLLGWRAMYWIAAAIMVALAIVMQFLLPEDRTAKKEMRYLKLVGSLWELLRSELVLQEVSILSILVYGSFNVFWVTLSFSLEAAPYYYGSDVVGIFGLVGIGGALAALFVGKFTDYGDARYANGIALLVTLLSFVIMWLTDQWLIGLIIGALLLDLGTQSHQVANEARIYRLDPASWNRLNTVHIFLFCIGGSLGSQLGTLGWRMANRNGAYGVACFMLVVALGFYVLHGKRLRQSEEKKRGFSARPSMEVNPLY